MPNLKDWLPPIAQGLIANMLWWAVLAAGGIAAAVWVFLHRLRARRRSRPLAIAYPLNVSMLYAGDSLDPANSSIQVYCSVALYAVKRSRESPTVLMITGIESPHQPICQVELGRVPDAVQAQTWSQGLAYGGRIRFIERNLLLRAIERTHGGKLPETGPVFLEVRVSLPTGLALAEHAKARVQFGLLYSDPPCFTVKIENWPNGVPEYWRQPAFMDFIREK